MRLVAGDFIRVVLLCALAPDLHAADPPLKAPPPTTTDPTTRQHAGGPAVAGCLIGFEAGAKVRAFVPADGQSHALEIRGASGSRIASISGSSPSSVLPLQLGLADASGERLPMDQASMPMPGSQHDAAVTSSITLRSADGASARIAVFGGAAIEFGVLPPGSARTTERVAGAPVTSEGPVARQRHAFALHPAHPNPFGRAMFIRFEVPEDGHAVLELFDPAGRRAATLFDGPCVAGSHTLEFSRRGLAKGRYYAKLEFTNAARTVSKRATRAVVKLD